MPLFLKSKEYVKGDKMLIGIKKCFKNPWHIFDALRRRGFLNWLTDTLYLRIFFRAKLGYSLDLKNPKTFNEKLQWLKLYDRNPLYTQLVDKYEVRKFVAEKIGEEHLIPLLGVWNNIDKIDFNVLPNQFVLKYTHDSGSVIICKDKNKIDIEKMKQKLKEMLKIKYFYMWREWPYKNVKPRIIAEKYMGDNFDDYKMFVFNGKPDNVMVCTGRQTGNLQFYFFDLNWNLLRLNYWGLNAPSDFTLPKPEKWDEMIRISKELSRGTHFLRVDLYQKDNQVYFGELTFFPSDGFDAKLLPSTDALFGEKLELHNNFVIKNGG